MKNIFSTTTLVAAFSFLVLQTCPAQPWALPTNSGAVTPPPPRFTAPAAPVVATPPPVVQPQTPPPSAGPLPAGVLLFDAETKEYVAKPGEMEAKFTFNVTNISSKEVTVTHVQTSCGCTVAHLTYPWKIAPGTGGEIPVTMNLAGKSGVVFKTVTVNTDMGQKPLMVKTTIQPGDAAGMTASDREKNQLLAKADSKAIFKGDCARCHVLKGLGKVGKELYIESCGICHDAEHRASMVPDLHNLPHPTDADFWRLMITMGKPGTLMPGFSIPQGGPLTDAQINSLVEYLSANFFGKDTNAPAMKTAPKI